MYGGLENSAFRILSFEPLGYFYLKFTGWLNLETRFMRTTFFEELFFRDLVVPQSTLTNFKQACQCAVLIKLFHILLDVSRMNVRFPPTNIEHLMAHATI